MSNCFARPGPTTAIQAHAERVVRIMAPTRALVMHQKWASLILAGEKTWEVRGCKTSQRGRICLAVSGTKQLVGEVSIVGCIPIAKRDSERGAFVEHEHGDPNNFIGLNYAHHKIDNDALALVKYKTVFAWILERPEPYPEPRPYVHNQGAVAWVNLQPAPKKVAKPTMKRPSASKRSVK